MPILKTMTERQAAMLTFRFGYLPGWGTEHWEFEPLREAVGRCELSLSEASRLISLIEIVALSSKSSPAYAVALREIQILNRNQRLLDEHDA